MLKSQNFEPEGVRLPTLALLLEKRYVSDVIAATAASCPFVEALCAHFRCRPNELEQAGRSPCDSGKEIYVRSVVNVDVESGRVNFTATSLPRETPSWCAPASSRVMAGLPGLHGR